MKTDVEVLGQKLRHRLPSAVCWFFSVHAPGSAIQKTYHVGKEERELRNALTIVDGPSSVWAVYNDLLPWTRGKLLPLLSDMTGQFVGVDLSEDGGVFCTSGFLGHLEDDVRLVRLSPSLQDWWRSLSPTPVDPESARVALARRGTFEECERMKRLEDLSAIDDTGRTLLDLAAGFGNLSVVRWCLENQIPGTDALSRAFFGVHWEVIELLLKNGFGLDSSSSENSHRVPVKNRRWMVPADQRERYMMLLGQADQNFRKIRDGTDRKVT